MNFTAEQLAVINAPKGNILVSAAAGSGKTAVMTERMVRRICAGEADIRRLLVLTFTKNAASSMKVKIEERLLRACREAESAATRHRLQEQLRYLPLAQISTFHAFCNQTLKDYGSGLTEQDLPEWDNASGAGRADRPLLKSAFGLMDEQQSVLMLNQSIQAVCEQLYEAAADLPPEARADDPFLNLMDRFFRNSINRLTPALTAAYHRLRSLPDYPEWMRKRLALYDQAAASFADSAAGELYLSLLNRMASRFMAIRRDIEALMREPDAALVKNQKTQAERLACFREILDRLAAVSERLQAHADGGQPGRTAALWSELRAMGQHLPAVPALQNRRTDHPAKTELIGLLRMGIGELAFHLSGQCAGAKYRELFIYPGLPQLFEEPAEAETARLREMAPLIRKYAELLMLVDVRFTSERYRQGYVDYGDLEQLALKLVRQPELAAHYRDRFQEIYVDEFQDTNDIQMAILEAFSADNLFVVGDVKQSIYRFRYARPEIFIDLAGQYQDNPSLGTCFELHRNFRSRAQILRGVNRIFENLMIGDYTEIRYSRGHAFSLDDDAAEEADDPADDPARLHIFCGEPPLGSDPDGHDASLAIADRILELHRAGRPYGDICVLMYRNDQIRILLETLTALGIPALAQDQNTAGERYERRLMTAMLHVLDNPLQDTCLLTVMTSCLDGCGFDETELLVLRLWADYLAAADSGFEAAGTGAAAGLFEHSGFWGRLLRIMSWRPAAACAVWRRAAESAIGVDAEALYRKTDQFRIRLAGWRRDLEQMPVFDVYQRLFLEGGFVERMLAQPNGAARVDEMHRFMDMIRLYESAYAGDVHDLAIRMLAFDNAPSFGEKQAADHDGRPDAVYVMTDHGSKGLEFPVVIMGDIPLASHVKDEPFMMSERLGIGTAYYDKLSGFDLKKPTLMLTALQHEAGGWLFAEKLRLIYVGMTRAMEELHLYLPKWLNDTEERGDLIARRLRQAAGADISETESVLCDCDLTQCRTMSQLLVLALYAGGVFRLNSDQTGELNRLAACLHGVLAEGSAPPPDAAQPGAPPSDERGPADNGWGGESAEPNDAPAAGIPAGLVCSSGNESDWLMPRYKVVQTGAGGWQIDYYFNAYTQQLELAGIPVRRVPIRPDHPNASPFEPDGAFKPDAGDKAASPLEAAANRTTGAAFERLLTAAVFDRAAELPRAAAAIPAKVTVSELKRFYQLAAPGDLPDEHAADAMYQDGVPLLRSVQRQIKSVQDVLAPAPADRLSGALLGSLLHRCFQLLELTGLTDRADEAAVDEEVMERQILLQLQQMAADGQLTADEWRQLMPFAPAFRAFARSDLAARIRRAELAFQSRKPSDGDHRFGAYREMPFTLTVDPRTLYRDCSAAAGDRVMVQGIIDLWFDDGDGAVVIDYKSDDIRGNDADAAAAFAERYRVQLQFYAEAVRLATGKPVKEQWIWSIRRNRAFRLA